MDAAGVNRAVLVPHGERNGLDPAASTTLLCVRRSSPGRFGVIGVVWSFDDPRSSTCRPGSARACLACGSRKPAIEHGHPRRRTRRLVSGERSSTVPVMLYARDAARSRATSAATPTFASCSITSTCPSPLRRSLAEHVDDMIALSRYPCRSEGNRASAIFLRRLALSVRSHTHFRRVVDAFAPTNASGVGSVRFCAGALC